MKPPLLKVALVSGRDTLKLLTRSEAAICSANREMMPLSASEISLELRSGMAPKKQSWIWLGNSSEQDLEGWLGQSIRSEDLIICFWPVGLTPSCNQRQAREYRVLLRSENERISQAELLRRAKEIRPGVAPVAVELPAAHGSGSVFVEGRGAATEGGLRPCNASAAEWPLPLTIESVAPVELLDTPIGEGFHWEHTETLVLPSPVWIAASSDGKLCAGVEVDIEDYLASVNSSEMPADSPLEFLKAQVVAARSWLLANWGSHHPGEPYIVCSGDHCQCYYGPSRIKEASLKAVEATRSQVLTYDERICDARYAKICGGFTEPAANVWPFVDEPYLGHICDLPVGAKPARRLAFRSAPLPNLSQENDFRQFQQRQESTDSCCSPGFASVASAGAQPLKEAYTHAAPLPPDFTNLYRWREKIHLLELREIIKSKTGQDLGQIQDLVPGRRGLSGRLIELTVIGSKERFVASPELEIRRALSRTHLPSSAFWIERVSCDAAILHGLGWGHGVGMCQVGAAALAARGLDYEQILAHYYPKTSLKKID